jgi:tRNA modification GTPase
MHGNAHLETRDTIVALATATGPGGRAIVRLSGPDAVRVATSLFVASAKRKPRSSQRELLAGAIHLPNLGPLPADLYLWPGPRSYTGQDVAELHTLSCPPLVDLLVTELLRAGARAARPGEFTLRAFLAGKLDLTRAEAVLGVIEAGDRDELRHALKQLAGGVGRPMQALRDDLLNLLADVEAGLDFADEDIRFIHQDELLLRIGKGLALVMLAQKQLRERVVAGRPFRAVLAGRPNAGKSSLFNALTGAAALVSPEPGTTRDYLVGRLDLDGFAVELVDTAGLRETSDAIDHAAQALGREQSAEADLVLLCLEAGQPPNRAEQALQSQPHVVAVTTKSDLSPAPPPGLATSAVTGSGLEGLRALLADRARGRRQPALAPSLSRCTHHLDTCLACLRRAHAVVLNDDPPELLAFELRETLEQLGQMVGAVYTDELLDRVFSRFCIGK